PRTGKRRTDRRYPTPGPVAALGPGCPPRQRPGGLSGARRREDHVCPAGLPELISDADCARFLAGLASAGGRHRDICALRRASGPEAYVAFDAATIQTTTG